MDKQTLVTTLKSQHRLLQSDLLSAKANVIAVEADAAHRSYDNLVSFKAHLTEHSSLENDTFYPEYLKLLGTRGNGTSSVQSFIGQMDAIGKVVMDFLAKYDTPEAIASHKDNFRTELYTIIATLNMRIESEEEGVYDIYLCM